MIVRFYSLPFIIIQLINLLFFILFNSYFEEYETYISSAIEGIYTKPAVLGWDSDTHFLLIYIYSWLAKMTNDYNIYGIILFFNNWCSLTFLGCILYRILRINISNSKLFIFILLYSIVCVDNMLNLNSVRIAFVYTAAVLGYMESMRFENKFISKKKWFCLSMIVIYAGLIRFESVLMFSIIYVIILLIHKRFYKLALVPVFISGSIYLGYNLTVANFSSEEKKVFIYKEREIFDRYNIDYNKLSALQKLDVDAIMNYCITDKEHFTLSFYDSISRNHPKNGYLNVFNGFNYDSLGNTWMITKNNFYAARFFFIFFWISGLFILFKKLPNRKRYFLIYLFLALLPLLLCFYTVVPLRFLIPFLSLSGCLNVFIFIKYTEKIKTILWFCLIILSFIFSDIYKAKKQYEDKSKKYNDFSNKLLLLDKNQHSLNPIVINSIFPVNYFPVKPLEKLTKQHAVFLNSYLLSADDYQIQTWKELCHCNTFSLKERVDYIVANQNLFLIDDKAFDFMKVYFEKKYHLHLQKTVLKDFDRDLKVCRLSYVSENK